MATGDNARIKKFVEDWKDKKSEKGESQKFWLELLRMLDAPDPERYIEFEKPTGRNNNCIDGYIAQTNVLIEQKSANKDLTEPAKQSDGTFLTPYEQAIRYDNELPRDDRAKYIITCNFQQFLVYDMNQAPKERKPRQILLKDLGKRNSKDLAFLRDVLVSGKPVVMQKEVEVSVAAGKIVGRLYDALLSQYMDTNNPDTLKSLNVLCVRLVFCLYAEDAGVFGERDMFLNYMRKFDAPNMRRALISLFQVLNTMPDERDPYLEDDLAAFPYVNGGLFAQTDIEIPQFTEEIRAVLLDNASANFDWSSISPTIFGAVFESTLNPEARRSGGMHYTSIENIHKVIDPLFLDELRAELADIRKTTRQKATLVKKLTAFQNKLAGLTFFDPACGSGNFLTETYVCLRGLENEVLKILYGDQVQMGGISNPIKVSISQFYGIEIHDFAVTVAKTALWIAESQMMKKTEDIVHMDLDFLPLKTNAYIAEGNALRMDWADVISPDRLNYIMGNPPFVGYSLQTSEQKADILSVFVDERGRTYNKSGKIDYVAGWFFKAAQMMQGREIKTALVATNSITQGEQVAAIWKPLYDRFGIHIDFAYTTFHWNSESKDKAAVHCVIVGFSCGDNAGKKRLYTDGNMQTVDNINAYLIPAQDVFIESRTRPICDVPVMSSGGKPVEGGFLIFSEDEKDAFIRQEPLSEKFFRPFVGAEDFIYGSPRYCLWLVNVAPHELRQMPRVIERIEKVREYRLASLKEATRACASTPTRFMEIKTPSNKFIFMPATSSEGRVYIPMDFLGPNYIVSNAASYIDNADLYHFGVLTSAVHMAWMRVVCGRLESRYRYSNTIVYNNFPWPTPTDEQRKKIEKTAQAILDARALYPDSSLADLYNELTMPPELRRAHMENDRAVMNAYGFAPNMSEHEIVAKLMQMYQQLVAQDAQKQNKRKKKADI